MTPEAKKQLESMVADEEKEATSFGEKGPKEDFMRGAQAAWDLALKYERERLNEGFFLELISRWKFVWMDVKGTDHKDRENYHRRAFGIDANMQYSLARMIEAEIKK